MKIAEEHGKQKAAYYAGWQAGYNQSRGKYSASFCICLLCQLLFPAFISLESAALCVSCLHVHSKYFSIGDVCVALSFINILSILSFLPCLPFSAYVKCDGSVVQILNTVRTQL